MGFEHKYTINIPIEICRKACRLDLNVPNVIKFEESDNLFIFKDIHVAKSSGQATYPQNVTISLCVIDENSTQVKINADPVNPGTGSEEVWQKEHANLANLMWTSFVRAAEKHRPTNGTVATSQANTDVAKNAVSPTENNITDSNAGSQNNNATNHNRNIIIAIAVGVIVFIVVLVLVLPLFSGLSTKTYVYDGKGTFRGEFKINFDNGTYEYSGNDIELFANDGVILASRTITKSGMLYNSNETINGSAKYTPSGMDYYMFVSSDKQTIYYGGCKFKLK